MQQSDVGGHRQGGLAGSVVLLEEKIKCNWFGITLKRKRKSVCVVVGEGVARARRLYHIRVYSIAVVGMSD
jgi:hypothetical protein